MKSLEVEQGRVLTVNLKIKKVGYIFVNVYAPNHGPDRLRMPEKLNDGLKQHDSNLVVIMGGNRNCNLDFTVERNGDEPHPQSANTL